MVATPSTTTPLGSPAPPSSWPIPTARRGPSTASPARGTLVAFVCNHCPYVRHIAAQLGAAAARWRRDGVGVVGINSNDAGAYPNEVPARMAEWKWWKGRSRRGSGPSTTR